MTIVSFAELQSLYQLPFDRSDVDRMMQQHRFPRPQKIANGDGVKLAWLRSDIDARVKERNARLGLPEPFQRRKLQPRPAKPEPQPRQTNMVIQNSGEGREMFGPYTCVLFEDLATIYQLPYTRRQIMTMVASGTFPKPRMMPVSPRRTIATWLAGDIEAWIRAREANQPMPAPIPTPAARLPLRRRLTPRGVVVEQVIPGVDADADDEELPTPDRRWKRAKRKSRAKPGSKRNHPALQRWLAERKAGKI
jgi:predicted DNA-binding transcriptional regulator AlpA